MSLIFCLPHAGGGAHHYSGWAPYFAPGIEWEPLDYAGHFSRMNEHAYTTFEHAVQDLTDEMISRADGRPFAVFGHSMGGALAYEIAHLMVERQMAQNLLFIAVSSALPPHRRDPDMLRYYELSDRDFIQHLVDTDGISSQLAELPELMSNYLPLIRKDYQLYQQYQPQTRPLLFTPLFALWGEQEEVHNLKMPSWVDLSRVFVGSGIYPGGHFYWRNCLNTVTADISTIVEQLAACQTTGINQSLGVSLCQF
ncbi:thioesterase II family protein [Fluviispira multicolorata]|uniref:Alpha/beta fold hydrolase n=1 Tax=Fluviispira multicolorata TaxID=2654512 RepID=A0A833JBI6_9BACT|nr:alpha/beta fold hydrolase [Fluviispira multicolorata]KAB8029696.1 alpha/beta fold hydrolase [Fluviispira multicolorata]